MKCPSCKKEFIPKWENQTGCSKRCRKKIRKYKVKPKCLRPFLLKVECIFCGKEYLPRTRGQKHCSRACSKKKSYLKHEKAIKARQKNYPSYGKGGYIGKMKASGVKQMCVFCGRTNALVVHHRDNDAKNNELENLVYVCFGCHFILHNYVLSKK